jgi:hypothetical protein
VYQRHNRNPDCVGEAVPGVDHDAEVVGHLLLAAAGGAGELSSCCTLAVSGIGCGEARIRPACALSPSAIRLSVSYLCLAVTVLRPVASGMRIR